MRNYNRLALSASSYEFLHANPDQNIRLDVMAERREQPENRAHQLALTLLRKAGLKAIPENIPSAIANGEARLANAVTRLTDRFTSFAARYPSA